MALDPVPWVPLLDNFPKVNGRKFNCLYVRKIKAEETYARSNFPYLGITLRPSLLALPGRNATKALRNTEHVYKRGLRVEFD